MARAKKTADAPVEEKPVEQEEKKVYSADEVQALLAAMRAEIAALKEQVAVPASAGAVEAKSKERVTFRWQAPVSKDNVLEIGPGGRWATITGPEQTFSVPKEELSVILNAQIRNLLDLRWLIVLSGLEDDELAAIGCNYRDGEVLTRQAFKRLADLGMDIVPIYRDLCPGNREIVAKTLYEAWSEGKPVGRDVITALREIDPDQPAFRAIIEEMNARDAK